METTTLNEYGTAESAAAVRKYWEAERLADQPYGCTGLGYGRADLAEAMAQLTSDLQQDPFALWVLTEAIAAGEFDRALELIHEFPLTLEQADAFARGNGWCFVVYGDIRNRAVQEGLVVGSQVTEAEWHAGTAPATYGLASSARAAQRWIDGLISSQEFERQIRGDRVARWVYRRAAQECLSTYGARLISGFPITLDAADKYAAARGWCSLYPKLRNEARKADIVHGRRLSRLRYQAIKAFGLRRGQRVAMGMWLAVAGLGALVAIVALLHHDVMPWAPISFTLSIIAMGVGIGQAFSDRNTSAD